MNFNPILTALNGNDFVSKDFSELINFNKAILDGEEGFIYDRNKDFEELKYRVENKNGKIYIDSSYFKGKYLLELLPTGFNLREEDGSVRKEYVNIFCIENQKVFIAILQFLENKMQVGLCYTTEKIAKEIPEAFPQDMTWDQRCDVTERVFEILIENNSVTKGIHQGETTVDVHRNTSIHLLSQKYVWRNKVNF